MLVSAGTSNVLLGTQELKGLNAAGILFHGAPGPGGAIQANLQVVGMIAEKTISREEPFQGG